MVLFYKWRNQPVECIIGKSSLHLRAKVGVVPISILTKLCWYEDQICFTTLSFDAYSYLATEQRNHLGRALPGQSQGYRKYIIIERNRDKRNIDQQAIKDVFWNAELQNICSEEITLARLLRCNAECLINLNRNKLIGTFCFGKALGSEKRRRTRDKRNIKQQPKPYTSSDLLKGNLHSFQLKTNHK